MLSKLLIGNKGEQTVLAFYLNQGYSLVKQNFFNIKGLRRGEIDLILTKNNQIIFIEVKTRKSFSIFGSGIESIDKRKQQKITLAIKYFLSQNTQYKNHTIRIDVCEVSTNKNTGKYIITNKIEGVDLYL